jgi:hypothetical protein
MSSLSHVSIGKGCRLNSLLYCATITPPLLALAFLGGMAELEMVLFVLRHPR